MSPNVVFFGQAVVITLMYLAMRREWYPTRYVVIAGVVASAVLMYFRLSVLEGADTGRALLIGLPLGAVIGLAVASIAWYFMLQERGN